MVKILDIDVGSTGYGLMSFNFPPTPTPIEDAIPVLKHAFDAGARFWNSAEFYGTPEYNNLHILHAYFTQYPEHASQVVLLIKVGFEAATRRLKCDEASIRESYENCAKILDGVKKIDIISCARVDPDIPVEETVASLQRLVDEGKIGGVGMSECSAATLRRAAKVAKIHAVEVELSLSTPDILKNGVAEAARDVGAVIVAYSPLGRGLLTGTVKSFDSLTKDDPKRMMPRFEKKALEQNLKLVEEMDAISSRLGVTKAQVGLAWVKARSGSSDMPQILPIPGTKSIERLNENLKEVVLSEEDVKELDEIVERNPIIGDRYPAAVAKYSWG